MTVTRKKLEKFDERISSLERQVSTVATKVDMMILEAQQQREDIRRAQEKHDADIKEMNTRFYEKMDAMETKFDSKFDKLSEQIHTMTIAAVVGLGAIAAAIGGLFFKSLK